MGACELCQRQAVVLTRHHLIPQSRHNKARTQREFSRAEMKTEIAMLCRPCHSQVHRVFSNQELADYYHTVERLLGNDDIVKFINWVKKRPAGQKIRVRSQRDTSKDPKNHRRG
ncbi:hypothetical protein B5J92_03330 [Moraxella atlantae]|nr:hypothetical protein A9306_02390 [Moraxella atlantae]OPH36464.1 hypothetical protein B5J92_03330 [Moraxella atlantae]